MSKAENAITKLTNFLNDLHKVTSTHSSSEAIENLKRWKERVLRYIASDINEEEARKFAKKEIRLMNMHPDTNLDANIEYQQSHLVSLLNDIKNYPDDYFGESVPTQAPGAPLDTTYSSALRLMHPSILEVSKQKVIDGHYADAVETAFKAVNLRVKANHKAKTGRELDGADLMHQTFSPSKPIISAGDMNTETGKSMQQGYMEIFAGSISAIRNPKAHDIVNIDALRAIHFLFLASLEMHKLDEFKVP